MVFGISLAVIWHKPCNYIEAVKNCNGTIQKIKRREMKNFNLGKNFAAILLVWAMMVMPMAVIAQTRISMPKNDYPVSKDVEIGRQAAQQVEQQMPILNDRGATNYVSEVGRRLVNAIPPQFQHPEFNYQFEIVNASDINAFALPGGPMYVNRGMIQAARNEGEMAGVMAHEISHVALRHATAQASKQNNIGTQLGQIGLILGGAILGGQTGAQLGALGVQAWQTKYSREYEKEADTLGAQIMARAGYDPHDLANMFKTIAQQGGGGTPEFLSDHPNPSNRFENINREAANLRISSNPIRNTREFERVQSELAGLPKARTMAEIERNAPRNTQQGRTENPMANGRYENRVAYPSRARTYSNGNFLRVNVPGNWQVFETQDTITFAPQGAYGDNGITHGAMVGLAQTRNNNLGQATEEYVNGLTQANNYLRQDTGYSRTSINGRDAYSTVLSGRSPITGRTEVVRIYTTQLRNGSLFYIALVSPQDEASRYNNAFNNLIRSIQISD